MRVNSLIAGGLRGPRSWHARLRSYRASVPYSRGYSGSESIGRAAAGLECSIHQIIPVPHMRFSDHRPNTPFPEPAVSDEIARAGSLPANGSLHDRRRPPVENRTPSHQRVAALVEKETIALGLR